MKKVIILGLFFLTGTLSAFAQAPNYSNSAIVIYNQGVVLQRQGKDELALDKFNQALKLQPNFSEAKYNQQVIYMDLANKYYSEANYAKGIEYLKKELSVKPKDIDALHLLARIYIESSNPEKASEIYERILAINPNDYEAQNNSKCLAQQYHEKVVSESLNSLSVTPTAPNSLYRLIKPSAGITAKTVKKAEAMLDLIWSEPSGKLMLSELLKKRVSINITQGAVGANATRTSQANTLYLYGFIPIVKYNTSKNEVNIAFNFISDFNNPNVPSRNRVYCLHAFVHEFGHAFINIKNPNDVNSIEEELGVSMIGYNVANKVITGKYLTREQTRNYAMETLESLLKDDHRNLPVFSGFTSSMQSFGVILPYPEEYSDLAGMYKTLLEEDKISPVPNFYKYARY